MKVKSFVFMFSAIGVEDSESFVIRAILVKVVRSDKDTTVGSMYVGLATWICTGYPKRPIVQHNCAISSTLLSKKVNSLTREWPGQRI